MNTGMNVKRRYMEQRYNEDNNKNDGHEQCQINVKPGIRQLVTKVR